MGLPGAYGALSGCQVVFDFIYEFSTLIVRNSKTGPEHGFLQFLFLGYGFYF